MTRLPRATAVRPDPDPRTRFSGTAPSYGMLCSATHGEALCTRLDLHGEGEHYDRVQRVQW